MDAQTVDQNYALLEQQAQQTSQSIQTLAGKLQAAATAGDANAREWLLDLKEITLGVQQEQNQTTLLLQAIHSMVDNHVQAQAVQPVEYVQPTQPEYQQPQYVQQGGYGAGGYGAGGGGMLQHFLGGGMGRAMVAGAGFGIGDQLINAIF